jgi:hypothetical protein
VTARPGEFTVTSAYLMAKSSLESFVPFISSRIQIGSMPRPDHFSRLCFLLWFFGLALARVRCSARASRLVPRSRRDADDLDARVPFRAPSRDDAAILAIEIEHDVTVALRSPERSNERGLHRLDQLRLGAGGQWPVAIRAQGIVIHLRARQNRGVPGSSPRPRRPDTP